MPRDGIVGQVLPRNIELRPPKENLGQKMNTARYARLKGFLLTVPSPASENFKKKVSKQPIKWKHKFGKDAFFTCAIFWIFARMLPGLQPIIYHSSHLQDLQFLIAGQICQLFCSLMTFFCHSISSIRAIGLFYALFYSFAILKKYLMESKKLKDVWVRRNPICKSYYVPVCTFYTAKNIISLSQNIDQKIAK